MCFHTVVVFHKNVQHNLVLWPGCANEWRQEKCTNNRCIRVLEFFRDRNRFRSRALQNCASARPKSAIQNSIYHFRLLSATEAREQNSTAFPHRDRVFATEIFPNISVANTRMRLMHQLLILAISTSSLMKRWFAKFSENLDSNPSHNRPLLWRWAPRILILTQTDNKPPYEVKHWYWLASSAPC